VTEQDVWLTMNDGVRLDASVVVPDPPAPAGGYPAVVLVHGHGEDGSKATTLPRARRLAERGLLGVCYSVRGQGGSEGLSFHLGARELFDLQDVLRWVRELPHGPHPGVLVGGPHPLVDSARIAVCGGSQGGWHAWMAAMHAEVATVVPENIFADYPDFAVPDGALSTWFFLRTMRRRVMSAGLQDQARRWAIDGDWDRLRANLAPSSPRHFADRVRCPVLVVHGWHDVGMPADDVLALFDALEVPKRLVLGGGGHDGQDDAGAIDARTSVVDRWLDHWLLGIDTGLLQEPPITVAVRPGWTHRGVAAVAPSTTRTMWLRHGGTLAEQPPDAPTPNSNLNHRPLDPAYTLEVALHRDLAGTAEAWPREEAVFDGPTLEAPLELLGSPRFELHVLPERPWYQLHAELWDVGPDGATLISRGHRGSRSAEAGRHERVEVRARAIAYRVPAGHRLRVVVADQHATYVIPVYRPWRARLFHEPGRASAVSLPIA
jgi:predicted acyl esterase